VFSQPLVETAAGPIASSQAPGATAFGTACTYNDPPFQLGLAQEKFPPGGGLTNGCDPYKLPMNE
jgi:hypothetical protein